MKKTPRTVGAVVDPYLPGNGSLAYSVSRYELELEYKVASNRLSATADITVVLQSASRTLSFDFTEALRVAKVTVGGKRVPRFTQRGGKLDIVLERETPSGSALSVHVKYSGTPVPIRSMWGEVGFEELTEGVLVASQPNGAASWFPCNDHPSSKASYRFVITTDSPYRAIANGKLVNRRVRAAQTTWTYEQTEPMASYLATLQIGHYEHREGHHDVHMEAAIPPRIRENFLHDFGRQPEMMALFTELFGPYPFGAYTVVVADDNLEIPIEAQGISTFGANHCDGRRSAERLVAHELAHQWFGNSVTLRHWRDIWLHEGFACYAEWLWSERSGGPDAAALAHKYWQRLEESPQDLVLADPGPERMFDDRVYKRGALTLHAVRIQLGDDGFFTLLRTWTTRYRHANAATEDFTDLAARFSDQSLRALWRSWLYETALPDFPA